MIDDHEQNEDRKNEYFVGRYMSGNIDILKPRMILDFIRNKSMPFEKIEG